MGAVDTSSVLIRKGSGEMNDSDRYYHEVLSEQERIEFEATLVEKTSTEGVENGTDRKK